MAELYNTILRVDANLKAYYRLEANGNDSTANGYNMATAVGSPSYAASRYNNGIVLDAGEALSAATNCGIASGAMSISAWIKLSADIASSSVNFIQQNEGDATDCGHSISYEYNAGTRRLYFRRSKWNVAHQGPVYNVALGIGWNHIVYTYDGTNVRGYLNGALVAGPTACSGSGAGTTSPAIGLYSSPNGVTEMDDVSIFNDALTAAEVLMLYRTNFKTYNGLVNSGVKSINGLATASVKSVNGLL